ncbi:MAG: peptide chain release factor 1 [Phycisphaerae bacterium]|nr:peptide chain release factor 1 [Phycisphaerae bacterium]
MTTLTVEERLLNKLGEIAQRFDQIEGQMNDPETAKSAMRLVELAKERGRLEHLVTPFRQYQKVDRQINEARVIAADGGQDAELREMAREEIDQLSPQRDQIMDQIKSALVTSEDMAYDSVIMEIRAGTGGAEAALFAGNLLEMYLRYAEKLNFKTEVLDASESEMGGFREVILNIKGAAVYSVFGYEGGGHRVQRVPETEAQGRIHTSAATVAVLPEPEEVDIDIKPDEVVESVSRAGGPGGQNVNKVASAIRLEHIATGIVVSMRDERSQHKNRAKAWRILKLRVFEKYQAEKKAERDKQRSLMVGSGDRSQRIRTYNYPQNRVTDHRIGLDLYSLDRIMMGDLGELVEALQTYDREQRLKNLEI